jgi:hypothetical protein
MKAPPIPSRWLFSSCYCSGLWIATTCSFGFGHCPNGLSWPDQLPSIPCVPLRLDNFRLGTDSIIGKYDESKADKAAERLSEKNLYSNPTNFKWCWWTGFGVWVALRGEDAFENNRHLFLSESVKPGTESTNYCEQVLSVVTPHIEELMQHIAPSKFNPYGLRKGSATHAVSGTTQAPSLPSIARRGEWSIGTVLDVYWHFGSVGDNYLGRILALLDPNSQDFDVLPPHWIMQAPMENPQVNQGMVLTFGKTLEHQPDHVPLLLRAFACMVWHSDGLMAQMVSSPGHDFSKLAMLHDRELLSELKKLVTLEPTEGVVEVATGIPPHVNTMRLVTLCLENVGSLCAAVRSQGTELVGEIKEFLEARAWESGSITSDRLEAMLDSYKDDTIKALDAKLLDLKTHIIRVNGGDDFAGAYDEDAAGGYADFDYEEGGIPKNIQKGKYIYSYGGKFYLVPKNFVFPKPNLRDGLRLWLYGMTVSMGNELNVRSFRKLTTTGLPESKLKNTYKTSWSPIFRFLEKAVERELPRDTTKMTEPAFQEYYEDCIACLKLRVSYCFTNKKKQPLTWGIATWSKRISRSEILKNGTEADKGYVGEGTARNETRDGAKNKRRQGRETTSPKHPRRQKRRKQQAAQQSMNANDDMAVQTAPDAAEDSFLSVFGSAGQGRTPEQRQRDDELQAAVNEDIRQEVQETEQETRQEEFRSTRLWAVQRDPTQMNQNHGDNSTIQRNQYRQQLAQTLDGGKPTSPGICIIPGCRNSHMVNDHPCYHSGCKNYVHNMCAQSKGLCMDGNELNMFCSVVCKRAG